MTIEISITEKQREKIFKKLKIYKNYEAITKGITFA